MSAVLSLLPSAALLLAALLLAAPPLAAQPMPVTTPRLPPHGTGAGLGTTTAQSGPAAHAGHVGQAPAQPQSQAGYGPANPQAVVAAVVPPRADAGPCRAEPTPDRQTLLLVSGAPALPRTQLPLGEFRAQQVVHSPDGRWAVVLTKLRGAAQYAAMSIDLERCALQRVVELRSAGEDVRFDGDHAVLRLSGGEQRIGLRDGSVR